MQRYGDTVSMNHKSCVRCRAMPPRYVHNSVSPPRDTKLVHDAVPQCHRNVVLKATQEMSTIVVSRGSLSVVSLARTLYLVTGARAQICPGIPLIPSASYTPKSWHNEAKQPAFAFLKGTWHHPKQWTPHQTWHRVCINLSRKRMTKMPDGEKTKFDIQKYHISFTTLIMGRMMKMTGEIFVVGEGGTMQLSQRQEASKWWWVSRSKTRNGDEPCLVEIKNLTLLST